MLQDRCKIQYRLAEDADVACRLLSLVCFLLVLSV